MTDDLADRVVEVISGPPTPARSVTARFLSSNWTTPCASVPASPGPRRCEDRTHLSIVFRILRRGGRLAGSHPT